jgi:transcriptional regulator with GAF, ATPase, and Fis domain
MASDDINAALRQAMADLTGHFAAKVDVNQTLADVTATAVRLIDGIDFADVMLIDDGAFQSVAPTDPLAVDVDKAQMRLQQGPCLQAALVDPMILCPNLSDDQRWTEFAAAAVEFGIFSMMSFQLFTHRAGAGALNLMGRKPQEFHPEAETIGAMLATQAAIALMAANKDRQFESALASRDVIGQAKGMIMERFNVDAQRAFELLKKISQTDNLPLRTIAQRVVDSPDPPPD